MKFIRKINIIFLGIFLLTAFSAGGVFYYTSKDNQQFAKLAMAMDKKTTLDYQKNFSGKIKLGTINNIEMVKDETKKEILNTNKVEAPKDKESLIFIGGRLETGNNDNADAEDYLKKISKLNFGPVIFTGNLIEFTKEEDVVTERIGNVKDLLSLDFKGNFNIAFGKGDIACGEKCVKGWSEILFDKKIKTEEIDGLIFAYAFEYKNAKVVLLGPNFFINDKQKNLAWLEEELKKNTKKNLILVSHNSTQDFNVNTSSADCAEDCSNETENKAEELFEKYGVNLVVFGDEDKFLSNKKGNILYVSSGNFENSLVDSKNVSFLKVDFNENEMTLSAYNNVQEKISEFKIR